MTSDDQKSIIIDVKMKNSEKWYALETDKKLRACTQDCRTSALYQGIGRGDEVIFTINSRDQFSYLKATGKKFDLAQLPQPATKGAEKKPIIIDADATQAQITEMKLAGLNVQTSPQSVAPKTDWERKHEFEQRKDIMIHWQALLNTSVDIVMLGSHCSEEDCDIETDVKIIAEHLHTFIMDKVDGGK